MANLDAALMGFNPEMSPIAALDATLADHGADAEVESWIDTTQTSRVAGYLGHVDREFRRATALLSGDFAIDRRNGAIRPSPPTISGFLLTAVEVDSTRARSRLHGKSKSIFNRHPLLLVVIGGLMVNT